MTRFRVYMITNHENNHWRQIIKFCEGYHHAVIEPVVTHEDGNVVTCGLIDHFKSRYPELTFLEEQIITALENDRQRFLEVITEYREILEVNIAVDLNLPSDLLQKHLSCYAILCHIGKSVAVTRQHTKRNGIPNCDLKHHFKRFDGDKAVMDFFNKNQCPVCMASYKKIIQEDRHIIVQLCGHPACKCCDEILRTNQSPKCPMCREGMVGYELDVMTFDVNLQVAPKDRRIYC